MDIIELPHYGNRAKLSLEAVLARPIFAHLATVCEKGPRDSPVWFLWKDKLLWIIANEHDTFPLRIQKDPRCAVGIVDFDVTTGCVHHVGFRGSAVVEQWSPERAIKMLSRYLGPGQLKWDVRFQETVNNFTNRWVRFTPETVVIRDQSYVPSS